MKKLDKNPIHLYIGVPCAICDTDMPVSDTIEGCDWIQDKIIAERVDWEPEVIKPVLRDVSDITNQEALEIVNMAWFPANNRPIEKVTIQTTSLFPMAAIYFDWGPFDLIENEDFIPNSFVFSLDNAHHTLKLYAIDKNNNNKLVPMQVYQSHKITTYLILKGFDIGILDEGTYIIRNQNKK